MSDGLAGGLSRRRFLSRSAVLAGGVALIGSAEGLLTAPNAGAAPGPGGPGYGPVVPDPAGRLALPQGFRYAVVAEAGVTRLDSGEPSPTNSDGMGAFPARGNGTVLVQNHELRGARAAAGPLGVPTPPEFTYDPQAPGGTTTIDGDREGRAGEYVSLAGTSTNCAGGRHALGDLAVVRGDRGPRRGERLTKDHGYVFEVDPEDRDANRDPQPIKAFGRFAHEAVAIDPGTATVYLTEDAATPNGLLYRWTPPRGFRGGKGSLRRLGPTDGALEAMRCTDPGGTLVDDLSRATRSARPTGSSWTAVPDRDARAVPTRLQFNAAAGHPRAQARGHAGGATAAPTSFRASPAPRARCRTTARSGSTTRARRRSPSSSASGSTPSPDQDGTNYDGPDNITVSPYGGVILAEDGEGVQHLFGATPGGQTYPIARNELNTNEMAGPVYSRDKRILFANLYEPGICYAITGPWRNQR